MPKSRKPCILNKSEVKRLFLDAGIPAPVDETIDIMAASLTTVFRIIARAVPLRQLRKNTLSVIEDPPEIVTPPEESAAVPVAEMMAVEPPEHEEPEVQEAAPVVPDGPVEPDPAPEPPKPAKKAPVAVASREPAYTKPVVAAGDVPCAQCMYAAHGSDSSLYCRNELAEAYRTKVGTPPLTPGCALGELLTSDNLSGDSDDDGTTPPQTV